MGSAEHKVRTNAAPAALGPDRGEGKNISAKRSPDRWLGRTI